MKILVVILALLAVPFIVGLLQNNQYESTLKDELKSEASSILEKHSVDGAAIKMDKVDASIEGVVPSKELRTSIGDKINAIDGLRLKDEHNNLKVVGSLTASRSGKTIQVSGNVADGESSIHYLSGIDNLTVKKSDEFHADALYTDSPMLANDGFQTWAQRYLSVKEDRSFTLTGNDLTLTGAVTPRLKEEFISSAEALQLNVTSKLDVVEPTQASLKISKKGDNFYLSGSLPEGYDISGLGLPAADDSKVVYHPFTEDHPSLSQPAFSKFVTRYFKPQGNRSIDLKENNLTLTGAATSSLVSPWLSSIKELNLSAKNQLIIYSSVFHFPSYKREAKLTAAEFQELKDDLAATNIYFESGSSEISESQIVKVELAASAIINARNNAEYFIGGYADATGDLEKNQALSKLRAQAVLRMLEEKGVDISLIEVASFGAATASSDGPSASDRRVKIIIR